jgi:hypothetical protein
MSCDIGGQMGDHVGRENPQLLLFSHLVPALVLLFVLLKWRLTALIWDNFGNRQAQMVFLKCV